MPNVEVDQKAGSDAAQAHAGKDLRDMEFLHLFDSFQLDNMEP
jgi:hypothetical protein